MKIGVFLGDIYQKYQSIITKTLEKYAAEWGITLYIFGAFATPANNILYEEGKKSILYLPDLTKLDGIITAGDTLGHLGMEQELYELLEKEAGCPVVSLRTKTNAYHNVLLDNEGAMYAMTRHFIEKHNARKICFVTGIMDMVDARERLEGYKKAMKEAGIPVTEDMVYYGDYWRRQGDKIVNYFIKDNMEYPEVIICSNDYMAISVSDALKARGIRIPEDICISGMDNLDVAKMYNPPMTSIAVPFEKMAKKALEDVVALAKGEDVGKDICLLADISYRESCGCQTVEKENVMQAYQEENQSIRYTAKECIYMSGDFESALSEKECIEWAGIHARRLDVENCFICIRSKSKEINPEGEEVEKIGIKLMHYMNEEGESVYVDVPFSREKLLPKMFMPMLDEKTNIFVPIHSNNEVYGYCIFQLKKGMKHIMDERFEFLCINMGNTLKRIYMYYELFSVKDIMHLYLQDPLTGMYNRRGFERRLISITEYSRRTQKKLAVVSIDMDGLKYINDTFGHMKGDESILRFSKCLSVSLNKTEFCARMGGDEFQAVLLLDEPDRVECFEMQLRKTIADENAMIPEQYCIDASVGIQIVEDVMNIMECIQLADKKMYENKRSKVNKQGKR